MNTPSFDRLLSVGQAAEILSLSTRSVRRLLYMIGFVRVGGSGRTVRIPQSSLEDYLRHRFVPPEERHSVRRAQVDSDVAFLADRVIGKHRHRTR